MPKQSRAGQACTIDGVGVGVGGGRWVAEAMTLGARAGRARRWERAGVGGVGGGGGVLWYGVAGAARASVVCLRAEARVERAVVAGRVFEMAAGAGAGAGK